MQLHLDLHENATRGHILDTLLKAMSEAERVSYDNIVNHAVIPDKHHHSIVEVRESIDALEVPEQVKEDLHAVYEILAAAEASVHGCAVEETHFHEVGNASGIRNALAICAAFSTTCCFLFRPRRPQDAFITHTPFALSFFALACALPSPARDPWLLLLQQLLLLKDFL